MLLSYINGQSTVNHLQVTYDLLRWSQIHREDESKPGETALQFDITSCTGFYFISPAGTHSGVTASQGKTRLTGRNGALHNEKKTDSSAQPHAATAPRSIGRLQHPGVSGDSSTPGEGRVTPAPRERTGRLQHPGRGPGDSSTPGEDRVTPAPRERAG
ncbi:unnamed protein product [Arctogadus glacialis]